MSYILKKKMKKGFTIVELVIVIAVIAVLASVLIPTFSSVIDKANESAALQEVQNAYIEALAKALGQNLDKHKETVNGFTFEFIGSTGQNATVTTDSAEFNAKYTAKVEGGVVVIEPTNGNGGVKPPTSTHTHVECPTCKKCTAADCDGDKCLGHIGVDKVTLNETELVIGTKDDPVTLIATVSPETADQTVTWNVTDDDGAASCVQNGNKITITGLKAGTAIITATANGGTNVTATCTVTVKVGKSISDPVDLKTALESGGTYFLKGGQAFTLNNTDICSGVISTLDLNGHTLTIGFNPEDYSLDVSGYLTIKNLEPSQGGVDIAAPENIQEFEDNVYWNSGAGINVVGKLDLEGVIITGNRPCNIENYNETNLTNCTYYVNRGCGFYNAGVRAEVVNCNLTVNSGTGFQNKGTAIVANGTMTTEANRNLIYCDSGTISIIGTQFTGNGTLSLDGEAILWNVAIGEEGQEVAPTLDAKYADVIIYSSPDKPTDLDEGLSNFAPEALEETVIVSDALFTSVEIHGGTFNGNVTIGGTATISDVHFKGDLTFTGKKMKVEIKGNTIVDGSVLCSGQNSQVCIYNGKYYGSVQSSAAQLTIENGQFGHEDVSQNQDGVSVSMYGASALMTIKGGTFYVPVHALGSSYTNSGLTIDGGTFNATVSTKDYVNSSGGVSNTKIIINGGTFNCNVENLACSGNIKITNSKNNVVITENVVVSSSKPSEDSSCIIEISGGEIRGTLYCVGKFNKIKISGGTFGVGENKYEYDSSTFESFANGQWDAPDYNVSPDGNWWIIEKETVPQ